jgi:hypothetical protein
MLRPYTLPNTPRKHQHQRHQKSSEADDHDFPQTLRGEIADTVHQEMSDPRIRRAPRHSRSTTTGTGQQERTYNLSI